MNVRLEPTPEGRVGQQSERRRPWPDRYVVIRIVVLLCLAAPVPACRVVKTTAEAPGKAVAAVMPGTKPTQPNPSTVQSEVLRYADAYINQTTVALAEYARAMGTQAATNQALVWRLSQASAAVNIASSPNPNGNLLDFIAFVSVTRRALEEDWSRRPEGAAFQPWLETSRSLETNAWRLAQGILTAKQLQQLRDVIENWWQANPAVRTSLFTRPEEFAALIRQSGGQDQSTESVFSLVGLDPTSGLDPAVREVTRTRLFAERALYAAQRLPYLLRWHVELLSERLLNEPQVSDALTNAALLSASVDRFSRAAESASQTAALLPDRLTAEREAIVAALESQESKLRDLSAEVSRTLDAGNQMSTSLNTTLTTFDALMKRFGVGEPSTTPPDTNTPPFNILDYAQTAQQVAVMAQQLDQLLKDAGSTLDSPALEQRIKDLDALSARAKSDVRAVLNHAFLLGVALIALVFCAALLYRRLAPRR